MMDFEKGYLPENRRSELDEQSRNKMIGVLQELNALLMCDLTGEILDSKAIDKAHKDVLKLLLQVLENGELTDSVGKKISLKHAIIILTTAIGADEAKKGNFGFGDNSTSASINQATEEKLKSFFSPEMVSRIDNICLFNNLTNENLTKIAELEILELNKILIKYKTNLEISQVALEWLINKENKNKNSARELRKTVRKELEKIASEIILSKKANNYKISLKNDQLTVKPYGRT